jgi:Zn finger protein HypA/HybF involved in hydrogenase expression
VSCPAFASCVAHELSFASSFVLILTSGEHLELYQASRVKKIQVRKTIGHLSKAKNRNLAYRTPLR